MRNKWRVTSTTIPARPSISSFHFSHITSGNGNIPARLPSEPCPSGRVFAGVPFQGSCQQGSATRWCNHRCPAGNQQRRRCVWVENDLSSHRGWARLRAHTQTHTLAFATHSLREREVFATGMRQCRQYSSHKAGTNGMSVPNLGISIDQQHTALSPVGVQLVLSPPQKWYCT